jgi:hypothetical protein
MFSNTAEDKNINNNDSVQFIYLRAWQQPDKANYSQALKQQYRIKNNILKFTNDLQIKKQTKHNPDVQYETYRV